METLVLKGAHAYDWLPLFVYYILMLTLWSPVVTIRTTRYNIHKLYVLPTQLYLCVLCESENKQQLFPYTALTL